MNVWRKPPTYKKINLIYFCLWRCWVFVAAHRLSLVVVSRGSSPAAVCRLPVVVASLVAVVSLVVELGLYSMQALVVLAHRLSSPTACGIFLD